MNDLKEIKVFRDPLYGYIQVTDILIWNLINAREFQRLKRIKHLGGVDSVFHTAEHSRFSHSLGVYHLAKTVVATAPDVDAYLNKREKMLLYCASLLHDIGHGPFSHAFESSFQISHEDMTVRLILEDTQTHQILSDYDAKFPEEIALIIKQTHPNKVLLELISSQLDVDRLDYLARDAYFTGAKYGEIDVDRIIRTMRVQDGHLVHKASSIIAIEDYLMSRYNMYWQVYFHPVGRSFELIVCKIYERLHYLKQKGTNFNDIYTALFKIIEAKEINIQDYLRLDDHVIYSIILESENHEDAILSDLSSRILHRRLFKDIINTDTSKKEIDSILAELMKNNIDLNYYFIEDSLSQVLYDTRFDMSKAANIKLVYPNGSIEELKMSSKIINALADITTKEETRYYYPKDYIEKGE